MDHSPRRDVDTPSSPAQRKRRLETVNVPCIEDKKVVTILDSSLAWFNEAKNESYMTTLINILTRKEQFSLRLIDWMTTNYCRRHRIRVVHQGLSFDLHADYRRYLAVYTKKCFDPFARRERITIRYHPDDDTLTTTVGQLNFMRWFLQKGVDQVLRQMQHQIEHDMREYEGSRGQDRNPKAVTQWTISRGPFQLDF